MQRRPCFGCSVDIDTGFEQQPRKSNHKQTACEAVGTNRFIHSTVTGICNISLNRVPPAHPPTHAIKALPGSVRHPNVGMLLCYVEKGGESYTPYEDVNSRQPWKM